MVQILELAERDFEITIKYLKNLQEKINKIDEEIGNFRIYMVFVENFRKNKKNQTEILELKNTMLEIH